GIAGADHDRVGFRIEGRGLPRSAAAVAPGLDQIAVLVARPRRRLGIAARGAVLAVEAAHVAFHQRPRPDLRARIGIAREEPADHAELVARGTVHEQHAAGFLILHDEGRAGHGVADLVVAELLVPDHLAGLAVERADRAVERADEDLVAVDGGAAVHH